MQVGKNPIDYNLDPNTEMKKEAVKVNPTTGGCTELEKNCVEKLHF